MSSGAQRRRPSMSWSALCAARLARSFKDALSSVVTWLHSERRRSQRRIQRRSGGPASDEGAAAAEAGRMRTPRKRSSEQKPDLIDRSGSSGLCLIQGAVFDCGHKALIVEFENWFLSQNGPSGAHWGRNLVRSTPGWVKGINREQRTDSSGRQPFQRPSPTNKPISEGSCLRDRYRSSHACPLLPVVFAAFASHSMCAKTGVPVPLPGMSHVFRLPYCGA
jgi:hypothetical protein